MSTPTSSSTARARARARSRIAAGAIALLVLVGAGANPPAAPRAPEARRLLRRPTVALTLTISSPNYRLNLDEDTESCGQRCEDLRAMLEDSVRSILAQQFAFLDWRPGADPPAATVRIDWIDTPPPSAPDSRVLVALDGPAEGETPATDFEFEKHDVIATREEWEPAPLRDVWLKALPRRIKQNRKTLVSRVLGRVALDVPVDFVPGSLRAAVRVTQSELRAASDAPVAFAVRSRVTLGGDAPIDDVASVTLSDCTRSPKGYSCSIRSIRFNQDLAWEGPTLTDFVVAKGVRLERLGVHLLDYTAAPPNVNAPIGGAPR